MDEFTRIIEELGHRPGIDDVAVLAVQLGLWLRPIAGAEPALQGRVVVYDYTAHREDVERQIGRSVVEHVSRGSLDADATARATDALCGHQRRTGPIPIRNVRTRSVS